MFLDEEILKSTAGGIKASNPSHRLPAGKVNSGFEQRSV